MAFPASIERSLGSAQSDRPLSYNCRILANFCRASQYWPMPSNPIDRYAINTESLRGQGGGR